MKLIAKQTIIADGVIYTPGQELPMNDIERTAAWLRNGAALSTEPSMTDTNPLPPEDSINPAKDEANAAELPGVEEPPEAEDASTYLPSTEATQKPSVKQTKAPKGKGVGGDGA